jgi:ABC-type dipeptide/oligopeptide/nickel transport system permease component
MPVSSGLPRYIAGRVARAAATVFGLVTAVFLLVRLVPGDPVDVMLGDQATPEDKAAYRALLHLDRPLVEQYGGYLADVASGSLGESFRTRGATVASKITEVSGPTVTLAVCALAISWLVAFPLGVIAAHRRDTRIDRAASFGAMVGVAVPTIFSGPVLILVFGVWFRALPLPGDEDAGFTELVLPSLTVGAALAAILMRQLRGALAETLERPYVLAARAKGLAEWKVVIHHALRNALLPVMTVAGAQLGALLSGLVVAEKIFEREGLGTLLLDSALSRDYPVVQGCVLVIGVVYVTVNLAIDLLYGVIDPRVRLS